MKTLSLLFAVMAISAQAADTTILSKDSYWRWHKTVKEWTFTGEATKNAPAQEWKDPDTDPAPAGWAAGDFDDSLWPRGRIASIRAFRGTDDYIDHKTFTMSFRGKFNVTDPAAVEALRLEVKYRGGVVVFLNGKEVKRQDVPNGKLTIANPASPYTDGAWVDGTGEPWVSKKLLKKKSADEQKSAKNGTAMRVRTLGSFDLPKAALHKGVNVLAVELRRSDYHPGIASKWFNRDRTGRKQFNKKYDVWIPIALNSLKLTVTGAGIEPNVSRPKGLRIWAHDINDRVTERDYGDPCEPLRPLQMNSARNGICLDQIIISHSNPIKALKVTSSELSLVKGKGSISGSAVEILYGRSDGRSYAVNNWFDGYSKTAPSDVDVLQIKVWGKKPVPDAAMVPALVRINVPKDAVPGEYRGKLTIAMEGVNPIDVPMHVTISSWTVSDPKDYHTFVGIYQSPTTVALKYGVEPYSEKHWKLLEPSMAALGRVGNKSVQMHIVEQTQFGNDKAMVYFIKKADGSFDYDFTVFDRYLALAIKHWGRPSYVACNIWHSGGWSARKADQKNTVTVLDKATGKFSRLQVPKFDGEEGKAFWKPVLAAIHARLAKLGLEKTMCIGILSDGTAPGEVFGMFDSIWPGGGPARWTRGLHASNESAKPYRASKGGGVVVLHEHCYGAQYRGPRTPPIWSFLGKPATLYWRVSGFKTAVAPFGYRYFPERALCQGRQGIGRICYDFWAIPGTGAKKKKRDIYNKYPHSSCAQRAPALMDLSWPGPEGAETTIRFEVLTQGLQETEALITISRALDNKADVLGPELLKKAKDLFSERRYYHGRDQIVWSRVPFHTWHYGWRDISKRTYDLAAEVAAKLKH